MPTPGVDTAQVADDAITSAKIAADAVTSTEIADDAVGASQLDDDAEERLLPPPTDAVGDAGKVAALNSAGTAYELVAQTGAGGGLNQSQVDDRIAPYARATPSGQIADAQIPAAITRDTELDTRIPAAAAGRIPSDGGTANQVWKKGPSNEAADWRDGAGSGGGLDQSQVDDRVTAGVLDWAETGNTDPIPPAKLTNVRVATSPVFLTTLGQPNLAETDVTLSGILDAAGRSTERFIYSVVNGQPDSGEQNIRWNPAAVAHSLSDGASYDSATGILTLPHGVWIIEAVMTITIRRSVAQASTNQTIATVAARLYEGGELRYTEDAFFWGQVANHPTLSVTGSLVVPPGGTDTVQVRVITAPGGSTNPTVATIVTNAHMEAVRLGDVHISQQQHIRAGWSVDRVISAAELTAFSASDRVRLGTNLSGFNYLALWRSDTDGGDPTEVHLAGGGNSRNLFGTATNFTYNGVAGKLIVSVNRQNATLLGGENARLV